MKPLKAWGGRHPIAGPQRNVLVVAATAKDAAQAIGVSPYHFRKYFWPTRTPEYEAGVYVASTPAITDQHYLRHA